MGLLPDEYVSQTKHLFFIEQDFDPNRWPEKAQEQITTAIEEYKKQFSEEESNISLHLNEKREFSGQMEYASVIKYTITFSIISFNRKGEPRERKSSFVLVFASLPNIYQATIDFGSEASQVLVYNCGSGGYATEALVQLFQDIGNTLGKTIDTDDNIHATSEINQKFIQFDPDLNLFRSHFFARKTFAGEEELDPALSPKENNNLVIMTYWITCQS